MRRMAVLLLALPLACAHVESSRLFESGTAALDRGDAAVAIGDLERASALTPDVSAIQNHLGIAYERSGRDADARRAYEKALELDCDNAAAQENLEALRARSGALVAAP
jgi:Flp pilus assembly protein TadD